MSEREIEREVMEQRIREEIKKRFPRSSQKTFADFIIEAAKSHAAELAGLYIHRLIEEFEARIIDFLARRFEVEGFVDKIVEKLAKILTVQLQVLMPGIIDRIVQRTSERLVAELAPTLRAELREKLPEILAEEAHDVLSREVPRVVGGEWNGE